MLAFALLAAGLWRLVPLVPLYWQGRPAEAVVVDRETLSASSYRATLEFASERQAERVRVSRKFTGGRGTRWLTVGSPVRIVHLPDDPQRILILSYPGADWLPPVVLLGAGALFAAVWKRITA